MATDDVNGRTVLQSRSVRAEALPRLMAGLRTGDAPVGLDAHADRWGPVDWQKLVST